jgi:alanyl aminopeptidase
VEKTVDFQLLHRETVAHEIAHQWFGNLVTLEWWDDLWLNESFATWLEGKLTGRDSDQRGASADVESMDSVTGRQGAMRADSLASVRAIHQPIESQDDFLFLFDPINYGKGGAVIAMFERWVGEDRFRAGVRAYIRKHAHGNATSADFLAALDAAAPGRDVAAAFSSFLEQPGVPLVSIDLRCEKGARRRPVLELRQERLLTGPPAGTPVAQRWKIPVCVEHGSGRGKREQCTLLDEASETLALEAKACPTWVNGNAGAAGYYRVAYGGDLLARILDGRAPLSARERAAVLDDAVALADAGRLSYAVLIAALPSLARERSFAVLRRAVHLARALQDLVPPEGRDAYASMVRALFGARARALGWKPRSGEPGGARLLRPDLMSLVAIQGGDKALAADAERAARAWLRDPSTLPPDAQVAVLGTAAAARGTALLYDAYRARLDQEKSLERRRPLLVGLARFRDPALIARTVELAASSQVQFNEMADLLSGGASDPDRAEAIYRQVVQRFAALSGKLGRDRRVELLGVGGALCSDRLRAEADRFFADKLAGEPGIAIARGKMRESIDVCAARRAAQSAAVGKALQGT